MADLETLQIQIKADADKAYKSINNLATSLNNLSVSIAKIETGKLNDLASGLDNLTYALKTARQAVKTTDYTAIVKNFTTLSNIDTARLTNLAGTLDILGNSFVNMTAANAANASVKDMASAIAKLGGVKVEAAINNLPKLEKALAHLLTTFAKLPNINQSIIDFVNGLSNLASQSSHIAPATKAVKNSLEAFGTTAERTTRKAKSLASVIGTLYAKFWLFMRGATALKNSFISAADYLEAFNYFDVTARKIGKDTFSKAGVGSAEQYAEAFTETLQEKLHKMSGLELDLEQRLIKTTNAKSLGLNITEITQYQASIASLTNSMGLTQETAEASSKALSMLAGDMASLKNMDFSEAASKLQSGLTGMARSLYAFGIDITNATLEEYAYANGIDKAVSEMTQAEKAQLRLLAILDQSQVAWGDLANTINSPANQLRMLKTNLKETGIMFGQLFIPVMESALPVINGLSLAIKQLLQDIAELLGIELHLESFGQFNDDIEADVESMEELNKTMKDTQKGIRDFDELKVINDSKKKGTGVGDQIDLTKQIIDATNEYEKVWNEAYKRMTSKADEIAGYISAAFKPIKDIIEDFHIGDFFKAGEDISSLVISITDFLTKAITDVNWEEVGNKIGEFISGIKWSEVFGSIADLISSAIQGVINLWQGSFDVAPFETAIITAFAILKFTGLGSTLTSNITTSITKYLKEKGIDKNALVKAGLGALSLSLAVKFTIDAVEDVQAGKYAVKSLEFFSKAAISSLLAGAGFTLVASALGLATGGGLLMVFGISAGLAMVFNIIAAELSKPEPNVERELAEQQYAWVEDSHLNNINVVTDITMQAGELNDQMGNIDFLASKVEDLSERYDELTEAERGQLKYYSDELVKIMPEIANQIDGVTGAYTGQKEELEKLIATQKAQIQQTALNKITTDIQQRQYELQPEYERLKKENAKNQEIFRTMSQTAREVGITDAQLLDIIQGKKVKGVSDEVAKQYKQAYENMAASQQAFSVIESDWQTLEQQYSYYMGEYQKAVETTMGNATQEVKDASEDTKKIIEKPTLPNAMSNTLSRIDTVIKRDGAVSEYDMNSLFENINKSFSGLGDGKVPSEVQTMMDNIKLAILSNSPELSEYMAQLKQLMIDSFVNAGAYYTTGGQVLYNRNGIAERLYKDVGKIEEGTWKKVDVRNNVKNMKSDLLELFGGKELPKEVDKAYKELAKTINSGAGQQEVFKAIDAFKTKVGTVAYQTGINFDFGLGTGIWDGENYFFTSLKDMYKGGVEVTKDENEINSPSHLYERLAESIPEGAALGIRNGIPEVELAVSAMSNAIRSMWGNVEYNVPDISIGYTGSQNGFNYGNMDSNNSFVSQLVNMANTANQNGQTEVVFRIEGDPYGMFKIIREENDKYKRQHSNRSAFN